MSAPAIRVASGALVLMGRRNAYKLYCGFGARTRFEREFRRHQLARHCPIWGSSVLPIAAEPRLLLMRSPRGRPVHPGSEQDRALLAFVEARLSAAQRQSAPQPALRLIHLDELANAVGPAAMPIVEAVQRQLRALVLPAGPVHGDLHRGNIVEVDGTLFVIDLDRFSPMSSPLFDRLNFLLIERQGKRPVRWLDTLLRSDDLVTQVASEAGLTLNRSGDLALAYGINRVATEAHSARLRGRPLHKYPRQAARLIEAFIPDERSTSSTVRTQHEARPVPHIFKQGEQTCVLQ